MASAGSLPAICFSPLAKRPACDFSALARVSSHSASSGKPSSRAVLAMPGYICVYSYVSPATASLRFSWLLVPLRLLLAICLSPVKLNRLLGKSGRTARPGLAGPALGTAAEELDAVVRDGEPGARGDPHAERLRLRLGQRAVDVHDTAAAEASEVMVRVHVGVEAGVRARDLGRQPFGDEEPQIAVDRAEAHAGQPASYETVHAFGGRVRLGAAQHLEDHPSRAREPEPEGAERRAGVFRNGSHYGLKATRFPLGCQAPPGCRALADSGRLSISGGPIGWRSPSGSGSREPGRTTSRTSRSPSRTTR